MSKAKELILAAKESGADAVKGQAFKAVDMLLNGVMDYTFYHKCQLNYEQHLELIQFGKKHRISVFFTLISAGFAGMLYHQKYRKIHAKSFHRRSSIADFNYSNHIISVNHYRNGLENLTKAKIMYATEYLKPIDIIRYADIHLRCNQMIDLGISHHYEIDDLISFLQRTTYKIPCVEKHFFLGDVIRDKNGQVYRDCLHSANPDQFKKLSKVYKERL